MRRSTTAAWPLALLLLLPLGLQAADLPRVTMPEARSPIVHPADAGAPTVLLRRSVVRANNEKVGVLQSGWFCGTSTDVRFSTALTNVLMRDVGRVMRRELEAAGYPRPQANESAFATPGAPVASDYEIGVTLKGLQFNACERDKLLEGGVWMQLHWELFAPKLQKVVYAATTEGAVQTGANERLKSDEFAQRALAMAARNLLADAGFAEQARKPVGGAVASAAAADHLRIAVRAGSPGGAGSLAARVPELQSAVVTLQSGAASGSGFYISADGYLLTNHHVVGDARYLKVKLATGRELVGEVLRSDRPRDIALVKTEAVALKPMDLATQELQAGDDVYALGSPLGEAFASSLTRGVLSGSRTVEQQRWLQSDVRILPGSSGGPLVSRDGAVVGVTSRGIAAGLAGLNLFIPIREAMDTLRVDFATD